MKQTFELVDAATIVIRVRPKRPSQVELQGAPVEDLGLFSVEHPSYKE